MISKYFDALELQGFDVYVCVQKLHSGMCAIILPSNIITKCLAGDI